MITPLIEVAVGVARSLAEIITFSYFYSITSEVGNIRKGIRGISNYNRVISSGGGSWVAGRENFITEAVFGSIRLPLSCVVGVVFDLDWVLIGIVRKKNHFFLPRLSLGLGF